MLAIIILCGMVGILVYFQVFSQGLFSALIMAILSICSAAVAINYQEPLATILLENGIWVPPYAVTLLGIFALTLLAFRELTDRYIRGNMNFSLLIDRLGSAVFALIAALVITGMIARGFQSLPIDSTVLGFNRCEGLALTITEMQDKPDKREAEVFLYAVGDGFEFKDKEGTRQEARWNSLFPNSDSFVEKMFGHFSKYCFSGDVVYTQVHPDLLQELYLNRVTPLNYEGMRHDAANDSLVLKKEDVRIIDDATELSRSKAFGNKLKDGEVFISVSVTIKPGANESGNRGAGDADRSVRFAWGHFRLVGFNSTARDSRGYSRYPEGAYLGNDLTAVSLNEGQYHEPGKSVSTELLFRWPRDIKKCPPLFLEFKHSARVAMPSVKALLNEGPENSATGRAQPAPLS
ncbi:MAG: CvpA family protein [Phycisphaerae bacterium]|nr:CvpA family protein [Phycisphaerae bacterium]